MAGLDAVVLAGRIVGDVGGDVDSEVAADVDATGGEIVAESLVDPVHAVSAEIARRAARAEIQIRIPRVYHAGTQ
jgi:hypothetical protein